VLYSFNISGLDPVQNLSMGTESEALRWKQWIDRWIKISSPEMGPTINSSASSSKIEATSASGQRKSLLTTEQLRYQLIHMVKVPSPW